MIDWANTTKARVVSGPGITDALIERINMSGIDIRFVSKGLNEYRRRRHLSHEFTDITFRKLRGNGVKMEFDVFPKPAYDPEQALPVGDNQGDLNQ